MYGRVAVTELVVGLRPHYPPQDFTVAIATIVPITCICQNCL